MRLLAAACLALAYCATAGAARGPTAAETRAFAAAVRAHTGAPVVFAGVRVSSVDPAYASVRWAPQAAPSAHWLELYRHTGATWRFVWGRQDAERGEGACAYVPAAVLRELDGTVCPAPPALHARPADRAEGPLLESAFTSSLLASSYASRARLRSLCVSRLDSEWAAGLTVLAQTQGVVW